MGEPPARAEAGQHLQSSPEPARLAPPELRKKEALRLAPQVLNEVPEIANISMRIVKMPQEVRCGR